VHALEKPNLMIVGAGGVGAVAAHKAVEFKSSFGDITLASRTPSKMDRIARDIAERRQGPGNRPALETRQVNARDLNAVRTLIAETGSDIVLNVAAPYCNETLLDACLAEGAHYIDTAVAEREHVENMPAPWYAHVEWPRRNRFRDRGLTAVLGMGFDPGAVNIFCSYAKKHLLDSIKTIDIIDVNGGDHGRYFATNFDADTNLREIREDVIYWENGAFRTVPRHSRMQDVTLPAVGRHKVYSMGHDEIHSLSRTYPDVERIEFWMGFSDRYLEVFNVLDRLGLLSSLPVDVNGVEMAPLQMVKAVLPDPASLAADYTGSVCIGCDIRGEKDGEPRRVFLYTTCDHDHCYRDVGAQAISYTTGVPAAAATRLVADGVWSPQTMVHAEEMDPDPFLDLMPEMGLNWRMTDLPLDGSWPF
jgi:saccharopine dehydrogenase-like NADP-dependent oxidoreductase